MPADITFPAGYEKLLNARIHAIVATRLPGGESVQLTPMWFEFDGHHFLLSTTVGRQVYWNLKNRKQASLCIVDDMEPGRYIEVRGHVVEVRNDPGFEFFRRLSERYIGTPDYPFHQEDEIRVMVCVEVDRKLCFAPMTTS